MSVVARVRRPPTASAVLEVAPGAVVVRAELMVILALVAAAWTTLVVLDTTGVATALHHHALIETGRPLLASVPLFLGAWQVMIGAMMVPAILPALGHVTGVATARLARPHVEVAFLVAFPFLVAFLGVWAAFGLGAFLGDMVVHRIVDSTPWLAARPWLVEAGILAAAGGYQFAPRKRRDLERCRRPADHLAVAVGDLGAVVRLGLQHGIACVGASWALMLLMFGEGFGSLIWMVALTGVMVLETYLSSPRKLSNVVGIGLILISIATLSGPFG
jgi:predicted metal-binding membrane protein